MDVILLKVVGLVLGFLGSIFLLKEPVRLRLKNGHVEVDTDMKSYNNRLCMRRIGIVLLAMSFITQIITMIPEIVYL
jgi:hypothetical protein